MPTKAADVFPRPQIRTLPISKGGDIVIDFIGSVGGVITNYPAGVIVSLQIDTATPIVALAAISAFHAVCRVEFPVSDPIQEGIPWRCVVSYPGSPTTEIVAVNGVTARADGKD